MSQTFDELQRRGKHCHWLTLDDRDSSIERLIAGLSLVFGEKQQPFHPTHALFRGQESSEKLISQLIQELKDLPVPVTLFIDNLHFCTDPHLEKLLNTLVFSTEHSVQLVLSSNKEIPLALTRAQLEGLVQRLHTADLSFSAENVAELVGANLCQMIGTEGLAKVMVKTEGWPAAVRLAQVVLKESADPNEVLDSFSGSDEALANFLNGQVFSGFPPQSRLFLLQLAQLRTFCFELCEFAINVMDLRDHFNDFINRNILVVPLDRNRRWYRLHGLFRDYLLSESAALLTEEERRRVQVKAAQWFRKQQDFREAIDYALVAQDGGMAIPLLRNIAPTLVRDREAGLEYVEWMHRLHNQGSAGDEETEYWFIWALAFLRRYDQALHHIALFSERLKFIGKEPDSSSQHSNLKRRLSILHASVDSLSDRLEDSNRLASEWLQSGDTLRDDAFNSSAAYCIKANHATSMLQFVEARQFLLHARESAFQSRSTYVESWVACYSGLVGIAEGSYVEYYPQLLKQLTEAKAVLGNHSGICGTLALIAARCAVGMGLNEEAKQLISFGISTSIDHGFLEAVACGIEAAMLLWEDRPEDVINLDQLKDITIAYPPRLSYMLACYQVRRLIELGRHGEAQAEASVRGLGSAINKPGSFESSPMMASLIETILIDLQIATGEFKQAQLNIEDALLRLKNSRYYSRLVELELAGCIVAIKLQNIPLATRHFTKAIVHATSGRIVRPFLPYTEHIESLLGASRRNVWRFPVKAEKQFFEEICKLLPSKNQDETHSPQGTILLDDLTSREHELLGYINAGLTNQQIADRIGISPTTVKWHLQNLYGKLGVSNRTAALAEARQHHLLDH